MVLALKSRSQILASMGARLAAHRLRQNLTQKQLAAQAGVAYSTLRRIERTGEGQMADYVALLQALGMVDHTALFLPEPEPSPKALFEAQGKRRRRASGTHGTGKAVH